VKAYDKDGGGGGSVIRDSYIRHGVYLTRFSTGQARKLLAILDEATLQIKKMVNNAKGIETKNKYRRISAEISRITKELSGQLYGQVELDLTALADEEMHFVEKTLKQITVKLDLELPAPAQVWAAASFGSYAGVDGKYTFQTYLNSLSDDLMRVWDINLRTGYLLGLPSKTIVRNVLGSVKDQDPGQIQKLRKSLEANTRTAISFMANEARNAVYEANSDIFSGVVGLSTLDLRCCIACGTTIDGVEYPSIAKAPTLPLHLRCRCLWLPKVKGMPEYLPGDERASFEGPVSASLKWKDWISQQPPEIQQDILGKSRFEMFKKGVNVGDFTEDGRILTLEQLAKK
jgi:hypothetical protein